MVHLPSGIHPIRAEQARITVRADGRVDVVIGTQPAGQGHETSFAQVVSDLVCVPVERVTIIIGDTDVVRAGGGTHSGRSMRHAATVFAKAADELIAKGRRIAAVVLGLSPDKIAFTDGRFVSPDTNRNFDMLELAQEAARHDLPDDLKGGLAVVTDLCLPDALGPASHKEILKVARKAEPKLTQLVFRLIEEM